MTKLIQVSLYTNDKNDGTVLHLPVLPPVGAFLNYGQRAYTVIRVIFDLEISDRYSDVRNTTKIKLLLEER